MRTELNETQTEVLKEILERYNEERGDLDMQTPDKEKAYKELLEKLGI